MAQSRSLNAGIALFVALGTHLVVANASVLLVDERTLADAARHRTKGSVLSEAWQSLADATRMRGLPELHRAANHPSDSAEPRHSAAYLHKSAEAREPRALQAHRGGTYRPHASAEPNDPNRATQVLNNMSVGNHNVDQHSDGRPENKEDEAEYRHMKEGLTATKTTLEEPSTATKTTSEESNELLQHALHKSSGLYRYEQPLVRNKDATRIEITEEMKSSVILVSCNYAVLDKLINWACWAARHNLNFLLLAMDEKVHRAAESEEFSHLIPSSYFGKAIVLVGKEIDSGKHDTWRQGQFNLVTLFKITSVRAVMQLGYSVIFSDIDVVFIKDPIPLFFPSEIAGIGTAKSPTTGVLFPLADFAYQQNECTISSWKTPSKWNRKASALVWDFHIEGNSGFYYMRAKPSTLAFLGDVIQR
jgi:hypothetical protein